MFGRIFFISKLSEKIFQLLSVEKAELFHDWEAKEMTTSLPFLPNNFCKEGNIAVTSCLGKTPLSCYNCFILLLAFETLVIWDEFLFGPLEFAVETYGVEE